MTFALIFPGQGSQSVGMGRALHDAFSESRAVFEEVDDALGQKLSQVIFEGPEETLTLTANAQPAIMAVSLAALRAMEARGFDVGRTAFVAGHSLGEYSALAAAGAFSVGEAARLLRIRGDAMQGAVRPGEGAMAAIIGLEPDAVEALCAAAEHKGGVCRPANDNGGGQIVISGSADAVGRAVSMAPEHGAKRAIPLAVSAPFHCRLMQPAAHAMAEALATAEIGPPRVPLVANVVASPVTDDSEIRERLVEQVTGQVRWRESVEFMARSGVDTFYEIGNGRVLAGLVKRIDKSLRTHGVGSPAEVESIAAR